MKKWFPLALAALVAGMCLLIPVGGVHYMAGGRNMDAGEVVTTLDLSAFSAEPPSRPLGLLFIHHSCGGQLLADPGPGDGENCIYRSHPNGGGLRRLLESQGYKVHEASYGSAIGDKTNVFAWYPKFRDHMGEILACAHQDTPLEDGGKNEIVLFKSCFVDNLFSGPGEGEGDPAGPELTVRNAMAAYMRLLEEFRNHPDVLFVCVTAPPLAPFGPQPLWKWLARKILNRPREVPENLPVAGALARRFANWLKSLDGWLKNYEGTNVVVFDYFDILTDGGTSNYSRYAISDEDSHPSRSGNEKAARALLPFLNRAVRRAGLCE